MPPMTAEQALAFLTPYLSAPERREGTLDPQALQGFLYALVCTPDKVPAEEWLPMIFGGRPPLGEDARQAEEAAKALYSVLKRDVREGTVALPPDCLPSTEPLANFGPEGAFGRWASGFLLGFHWLAESWEEVLPEEWDDEFAAIVMVLSFFADREVAEEYRQDFEQPAEPLETLAASLLEAVDDALASFAEMGNALYQQLEAERPKAGGKGGGKGQGGGGRPGGRRR